MIMNQFTARIIKNSFCFLHELDLKMAARIVVGNGWAPFC